MKINSLICSFMLGFAGFLLSAALVFIIVNLSLFFPEILPIAKTDDYRMAESALGNKQKRGYQISLKENGYLPNAGPADEHKIVGQKIYWLTIAQNEINFFPLTLACSIAGPIFLFLSKKKFYARASREIEVKPEKAIPLVEHSEGAELRSFDSSDTISLKQLDETKQED